MKPVNLTASEVSKALQIKYGTLTAWRRIGDGPPWDWIMVGERGYVVYPSDTLRAWALSEGAAAVKLKGERIGAIDALVKAKRGKP